MAALFRLSAAVALFALLAPASALAAHPYYSSEGAAMAACQADQTARAAQYFPHQIGPCRRGNAGQTLGCGSASPWPQDQCYIIEWRHTQSFATQWQGIAKAGPSPSECEARNTDTPPGPRLSLAQNTGPKCVGGCTLDIVGDPLETVPGRVQGQPVVYYRFAQQYTGETCTQDADPGDNANDLEETADGTKQCNAQLGVCVDQNGNNEYCTFNPDGTPSACVPAIDYDDDGVPDDNDTMPGDDTNGADDGEGNEADNMAAGGAACPHKGGQPPSCRGDAIQCNMLLQQYLTRCNAEKVLDGTVGGGIACSNAAPLTCTNLSPGECWEKAMQKKAACAAEGIAEHLAGGNLDEGPPVDPMSIWQEGDATGSGDDFELDMTGWLSNRACPVLPPITVKGTLISFDAVQAPMCNFFAVGRMLILLLAAFQAARILGET